MNSTMNGMYGITFHHRFICRASPYTRNGNGWKKLIT